MNTMHVPRFTAETVLRVRGAQYRLVSKPNAEETAGRIFPQRIREWYCNERYCCIVTLGYYGVPYLTCAERT